jgi:hypothetical protein
MTGDFIGLVHRVAIRCAICVTMRQTVSNDGDMFGESTAFSDRYNAGECLLARTAARLEFNHQAIVVNADVARIGDPRHASDGN